MTEAEIPQLHLSRDHIMAMTQVLNMLSQRLAEQRERRGRAAYSNAEHAARIADTHANPVLRPMSDTERQQFTGQAGDAQVPRHGLTVATAPVGQEWGVRAVAPTGDYAAVVCPNIGEAARLADYLRAENSPAAVNELNELSEQIGHRVAGEKAAAPPPAQPVAGAATTQGSEESEQPRLVELANDLPSSLTTAPEWERTEARFAELTAQGVDPAALAAGVQGLDFDRARRPDALVRWSLGQTAQAWDAEHQQSRTQEESRDVTAAWARQLDPTSALDRAAASEAVGRYGPDIDATLAGTYPGLLTAATDSRSPATGAEAEALAQQQRENVEALTAEGASRTLRGDDVLRGQGGEEELDREEAAIVQDGEAAEHRGRETEAGGDADRARDEKVTAQFTPARTAATAATTTRRTSTRPCPSVPVPTQTRTRARGR